MRSYCRLAFSLFVALAALQAAAKPSLRAEDRPPAIDAVYRDKVLPFLDSYCLRCHEKEKAKGDLDLTVFTTSEKVAKDLPRWELILEQIEEKTMPPAKAPHQPQGAERQVVINWIQAIRAREASRNAGDPGQVSARRLSNAEYDNTIRDLTGVDIRPTRAFPVDPANTAGFDNSAESLAMSPALVKKYLDAAREVADHLVLAPDGLEFADFPVAADTDRDKYCTRKIIDFYKRQRIDFADFFLAAWRYQHRQQLGRPDAKLGDFAAEAGISVRYLSLIWSTLTKPAGDVGPIAALQLMWRELPAPRPDDTAAARAGTVAMRDFVLELRKRLVPEVRNLRAPGIQVGSQALVLWKNRQLAANRRRYAGGLAKLVATPLESGTPGARALAVPGPASDPGRFIPGYVRFCATFPDAFFISERGRTFLDGKEDPGNTGRLLSAGFHNMMGYFRDDTPLSALILDDDGQRTLEKLWLEFDCVTGSPLRQHSGFLWYERAESGFMATPEFDGFRAEDKSAASQGMIDRLTEVYLGKASRNGANKIALQAIRDHFRIVSENIRRVEQTRLAAEPVHLQALQEFAGRAYRRPLTSAERDGIVAFYRTLRAQDGLSHEDAVRDTLVGILMSPYFCFRVDTPKSVAGIQPLSDHDLASRLSYFLWSSMPDSELLSHAAAGDLHKPEVLVAQARRMLKDGRIRGLATEFGGNWLDFRRFEQHNSVDRARFPSFDDELRRSMFEEPVWFFVDIVQNDRPVREFIDANHTFVNQALAKHYGMPIAAGAADTWVRVDDAGRYGRGGLLAMSVFLTQNSPGLRTSPVKRGYWVVRRLLGEHIPAPPATVPELPSDESKLGETTLPQALARHRADKACAGCHERFDAIGLAYEGYGPIGESRKLDLGGRPVQNRASFPGGDEGTGFLGLRQYLDEKRGDDFVDNLCRKLLAYALGRTLIPSDDATIATMKTQLDLAGGRFGSLIESIVTSPQFRNRRVERQENKEKRT
jgi:hypothetical protein